MRKSMWVSALVAALTVGSVAAGEAQVRFGGQASIGSDSGLGLGGRLIFPLRADALGADGAIDGNYFFGGGSAVDSWIDANVNLRIPVPLTPEFSTRFGAGLNAAFVSFESGEVSTETDTEIGLNVLASVGLPANNFAPFLELRAVLGGAEQVVLTGGFTVGGSR